MTHGWRRWRIAIMVGLVLMIQARLVWMQLRHYHRVVDGRTILSLEFFDQRWGEECRKTRYVSRSRFDLLDSRGGVPSPKEDAFLAWMVAPGSGLLGLLGCHIDIPLDLFFLRLNQWLLVMTVLAAVMLIRFITSSWTAAALVATMLLSRGKLLSPLGSIGPFYMLQLACTLWASALAHHFRTGSKVTALVSTLAVLLGSLFDGTMLILLLPMPFMLSAAAIRVKAFLRPLFHFRPMAAPSWMGRRDPFSQSPGLDRFFERVGRSIRLILGTEATARPLAPAYGPDYRPGGLFSTLQVPYLVWVYRKGRWRRSIGLGILSLVLGMGILVVIKGCLLWTSRISGTQWSDMFSHFPREYLPHGAWVFAWFQSAFLGLDVHYLISLLLLCVGASVPPYRSLPAHWETVWVTLLALILGTIGALFLDLLDGAIALQSQKENTLLLIPKIFKRDFLCWMEPLILSLAVAGIYNLLEVLDSREKILVGLRGARHKS